MAATRPEILARDRLAQLENLVAACGTDVLAAAARAFLEEAPGRYAGLELALRGRNAGELEFIAHAIKGSSANLGGARLAAVARELEELAEGQDITRAADLVARVGAELGAFKMALAEYLGARLG